MTMKYNFMLLEVELVSWAKGLLLSRVLTLLQINLY